MNSCRCTSAQLILKKICHFALRGKKFAKNKDQKFFFCETSIITKVLRR